MDFVTEKLFVYGTLLKGERNSRLLLGCDLLKTFSIPGRLYNTKFGYPAAVFDSKSYNRIYGELYSIPADEEKVLNKLDKFEGTGQKLFERKNIRFSGETFYIYEAAEKLKSQISKKNIIKNGRWLTNGGLANVDPKLFARNFELIHREYYRKEPDEISQDTIFLKGSRKILITCPHATVHTRKEKRKVMEIYTAAIGTILHSLLDCFCLYTNRIQNIDPNYYDKCAFKRRINKIASENDIKFLLDIHGTGSKRKYDVYPGIGNENEFLIGNNRILENLYLEAKHNNISVGSLKLFPAAKQMTVTKFAAKKLNIPSMQLEINQKLRIPNRKEKFDRLIEFLHGFLKDVSDNIHSPPFKNP